MANKTLDFRGETSLIEETLSDGSKVYDVGLGHVAKFHAESLDQAIEIFKAISVLSKTIFDPDK